MSIFLLSIVILLSQLARKSASYRGARRGSTTTPREFYDSSGTWTHVTLALHTLCFRVRISEQLRPHLLRSARIRPVRGRERKSLDEARKALVLRACTRARTRTYTRGHVRARDATRRDAPQPCYYILLWPTRKPWDNLRERAVII